ncbi:heparinase II/III family protein [Aquimarina latercula]|uniref:heparinase II/III family protein n=1 Tax=Aquimarina latercula TaxID=987 RepID=UPI00040A2733|nr:heparinase II/III family protein [Aquimarina latercula]
MQRLLGSLLRFFVEKNGILKWSLFFSLILAVTNINCQGKIEYPEISSNVLLRRVEAKDPDKLISYANTILENYINLNGGWSSVKYEDEIDWNIDPYNNPSWKNYFYSLRMLAVLSKAYEINPRNEYLEKGKQILHSWNSNYDDDKLLTNNYIYVWGDHAVANRVVNLVHFYAVLKSSGLLDQKIKKIITNHLMEYGKWLADHKNYTGGNHAVMMDRSLLYLSYIFTNNSLSKSWKEISLRRFNKIIEEEVTNEGVCVENSPQYHPFMMDLLSDFISIIKNFGDNPPKEYVNLFNKMKSYLVYVLKPNQVYPFQGDTYPINEPLIYSKRYEDPRFDFIESKGVNGTKPKSADVIFKEAGYAIFRDEWKTDKNFDKATYINFIGGVPSRIHKHSDNLSFSLFSNKEDLLIDPGSWGYAKNDTVSYLKSTLAHNTFTVNGTNYQHFPLKSCRILSSKLEKDYAVVNAVFVPNPFQEFHRSLIYIKPNIIILNDNVFSNKPIHSVSQIFNLGSNLRTLEKGKDKKSIEAFFESSTLRINQKVDNSYVINEYTGTGEIRGTYALRAERTKKGNQIDFFTKYDNPVYYHNNISTIEVNNENDDNVSIVELENDSTKLRVIWKDPENNHKEILVDKIDFKKEVFKRHLEKAITFQISNQKKIDGFSLNSFSILKWTENEYALIFKLDKNTTEEQLKKFTIGVRGYAYEEDKAFLSTYARQTKKNFDAWNIKENEIIRTPYGNYISININTNLKKLEKLKIYLFDRSGYKRELWNYELDDFYVDQSLRGANLKQKGIKVSDSTKTLNDKFIIEEAIVSREKKGEIIFFFRLNNEVTEEIIQSYKLGFHTYVNQEDKEMLMGYSKSKKRDYDAWDFFPQITEINGHKYIIKKIKTPITEFPKIKLFLYNRTSYEGVIGNNVEFNNITIK